MTTDMTLSGAAVDKVHALEKAGVIVTDSPAKIGSEMSKVSPSIPHVCTRCLIVLPIGHESSRFDLDLTTSYVIGIFIIYTYVLFKCLHRPSSIMLQHIYQTLHRSLAFRQQSNLRSMNLFELHTVKVLISMNATVVWLVQIYHDVDNASYTSPVYI